MQQFLFLKKEWKKRNNKMLKLYPGDVVIGWAFCTLFLKIEKNAKEKRIWVSYYLYYLA